MIYGNRNLFGLIVQRQLINVQAMKLLNPLYNFHLFHPSAQSSANCYTKMLNLTIFLMLIAVASAQDFYVTPTSLIINQVSSYTFNVYQLSVDIPAGSIVAITFPPQFNSLALHKSAPYSGNNVSNSDGCWPGDCSGVTIAYSGLTFTLSGVFTQTDYPAYYNPAFQYTIFNITNPNQPGAAGNFQMVIYLGSSIYYPISGSTVSAGPTFVSQTMSCSPQVLIPTIWQISPLKITMTPNNLIDTIEFTLLNSYPTSSEPVRTQTFTSTLTCYSVSNPYVTCASVPGKSIYAASNLYYSTAGSNIDITISSLYNPSSLTSLNLISINTKYKGSITDSCSVTIPSTSFTNDILRQLTATITYQTSDQLQIKIAFSIAQTSIPSDAIYLTFPADFTMPTNSSSYKIVVGLAAVSPTFTFYVANNTVSFMPYTIIGLQKGVQITVSGLARPRECKTTGTFLINTYRLGQYLMDSNTCCSIQLQNRQSLISNSITLSNSVRLTASVTYTFNFSTSVVNLVTTDVIKIGFPSSYSTQISSSNSVAVCASVSIIGVNNASNIKSPSCSVQLNTIFLSSFIKSNYASSETFIVKITGITNPNVSPTDGFYFATLSTNGYVLEEVKAVPITITTSQLTTFQVTPSSYVTCATNVLYTFTIGNSGALSNGYVIQISFPVDIYFINYNTLICQLNGGNVPCARTTSSYSTSTHVIDVLVNTSIVTITALTISSVTNPYSLATTGSFSGVIMDSSGQSVETSSGTTTTTMLFTGNFLSYFATTTNYSMASSNQSSEVAVINQQTTSIYITIVLPYSVINGSTMTISLFNTSYIQSSINSTCSSPQFVPQCSFATNVSSHNLEVTFTAITFVSSASNFININLNNVLISDYKSMQISSTALFVNGYNSLSMSSAVNLNLMYIESVSSYTITQTSYILGMTTSVSISITLSTLAAQQLSYFKVYIPLQYGAGSHSVVVLNSSFIGNTITLSGLTNPTSISYTPFIFTAFNTNNNPIAFSTPNNSSNTYGFKLICALPCKTCSGAACTSCYTSISWIPYVYLRSSNQTCTMNCIQGEYLSSGNCLPCNSNCLTCLMYGAGFTDGSSTTCLTCTASQYLLNSVCYSSCPSGYYISSSICAACMSNCINCTSYNTCTSCQTFYSLYNFQCISVCPISTVSITNNITLQSVCVSCLSNCLSCSSANSSICLTCNSGYYLSNGICVASCSFPLYLQWNGICSVCQCLSCSIYSYNCTSCSSPLSLYQFQCLSACPSGTYSSSNVCVTCPTNCSVCTSATYCSICTLPNALYFSSVTSSTCVSSCPNGTIRTINTTSLKYDCQSCTNNCLTCSISVSYCLSCQSGYYLHNYTCVSSCPTSLWLINNLCLSCTPECRTCLSSNPYNCSLCSPNYFLYNSSCILLCPSGTYQNVSLLTCSPCSALCLTCQTTPNCTSCISGYYLYNYACYSTCISINSSFFSYNGSCMICQSQCLSCLSTPFECSACSNPMYYFTAATYTCSYSCTIPYYANGTLCVPCQYPCLTCDTAYNSCTSCDTSISNLSLLNGSCIATCPSIYYSINSTCILCPVNCSTCSSSRCLTCLPYAYIYHSSCVLNCSQYSDLPITMENYCTSCASVSNCHACTQTVNKDSLCFLCVYPYVVFEGECLNVCPYLYVANANSTCVQSPEYAIYMSSKFKYNQPILPPFIFVFILVVVSAILYGMSSKLYRYSYHCGYLIALQTVFQTIFLFYGIAYLQTRYEGDYLYQNKSLPLYIIITSLCTKLILINTLFFTIVLYQNYLNDARYKEWFYCHRTNSVLMVILTVIFGCRFAKLYYSKAFGKSYFAYRIVSVQKFYQQDVLNWAMIVPDILDVSTFAIVAYNVFIQYSVLYIYFYELILFKIILWCFLAYDFKKPDRGFFFGDEEEAQRQINAENQQRQAKKRKIQMENLAKLIRRNSATQLYHQKLYDPLYIQEFRSVFDPNDYEDVPSMPNRRIQKAINRGKFRRGKRITIEQKLKRFAESIKPSPTVVKDSGYLKGLIYWKPPKQLKTQKKKVLPLQSEESMMKMLEDKQLYYRDELNEIKIQDLQEDNGVQRDSRLKYRRKKRFNDGDDNTIPDDTFDHFYDPSSMEIIQSELDNNFNGMLNLNYARRKHLAKKQSQNRYDQHQLRVLNHKPLKKRMSRKMNELSIRRI